MAFLPIDSPIWKFPEHMSECMPSAPGGCPRGISMTGPRMGEDDGEGAPITTVVPKAKPKTQRPPLYKVLLLNDDFTPMEFVVLVLERFFHMPHAKAVEVMLTVHHKGVAVVGVYTYEIAETKVAQVMEFARRHQHPLQCTMEKE